MSFQPLYRASIDLMLILASVILCMDVTGNNPLSRYYPLFVIAGCVASYFLVDRRPGGGLPPRWTNRLAPLALGLFVVEVMHDYDSLVLACGHLLVYLTLLMLAQPKSVRDDWFLMGLGLVQVVVGATLSQSDEVGLALLAWAVAALWALALAYLNREARGAAAPGVATLEEAGGVEPYPGLFEAGFVFTTVRAAAVTMALGGVIFFLMPRSARPDRVGPRHGYAANHLTGFTDTVRLGQLGEILENETVVMSVEFRDEKANPADPPPEPLWRGVTLVEYEDRRRSWLRESVQTREVRNQIGEPAPGVPLIHQQIRLEPTDSHVLFAMRPIVHVKGLDTRTIPYFNPRDGSIYREDYLRRRSDGDWQEPPQPTGYDYEVTSERDGTSERPQPGEYHLNDHERTRMLKVPEKMLAWLKPIADRVVARIPRSDEADRAGALDRWLGYSGEFQYTLKLDPVDPRIDPIEDFLENRKEGHCEYFASALTLLLRSEGIPARLVSGFKGGDWNPLTRVLTVRQKHAHTWVEAQVRDPETGRATWRTYDPTAGTKRDQLVASLGGFAGRFRALTDFVRYIWVFYIVGFNADRQERVLYAPLRRLWENARVGFGIMWGAIYAAGRWLVDIRGDVAGLLLRGLLVAAAALLIHAALTRGGRRAVRRMLRGDPDRAGAEATQAAGVAFFARAVRLLAEYGLERPPAETPREFARRAAVALSALGPRAGAVTDVPAAVVDLFYGVRFGRLDPSPEDLARLEGRLDELEASLRTPAGAA